MSALHSIKVSRHLAFLASIIFLFGIFVGSVFIRIADPLLIDQLAGRFFAPFGTIEFSYSASLCVKEFVLLGLMCAFAYLPYGQLAAFLLLFYKGFCVGIVSAIACWRYSASGIKYVLCLVLPQNLIYFSSLLLAAQIAFLRVPEASKHSKREQGHKHAYTICFVLLSLGILFELFVVPTLHKILF